MLELLVVLGRVFQLLSCVGRQDELFDYLFWPV